MVLLIPLDEAGQPDLDRGLRLKAEIAARGLDLGKAFRHVAGLERQQLFLRGAAQFPLDYGSKVEQLFRPVIAEIVNPMPNPVRGGAVMRRNRAGNNVVDISEITGHLAVVEDPDRAPSKNGVGEQVSG